MEREIRTGARSLVETAFDAGVEVCFANPGTTEMPIVATLDAVPGMRVVLGLFEGVCTGAADGWARMAGRPAATLLHLGPGFANGLAHLHNARRARTPVVNWIGEHATEHRALDAPLASDIAALTDSVGWTRTIESPQEMSDASRAAVEAAFGPPRGVASLIIPADCQWGLGPEPVTARRLPGLRETSTSAIQEAARLLTMGGGGILLGGDALTEEGLRAAARVTAATGAGVWTETFASRREGGCNIPSFAALPYFPEPAREALAEVSSLVLVGAREPIAFFAYPDQPACVAPESATVHMLADPDAGVSATLALEALADELGAVAVAVPPRRLPSFVPRDRPLDPDSLGRAIAAFTPEGAIIVNEAATTGMRWSAAYAADSAPHTVLGLTGGAIGTGLPLALGAALACPDRRVIAFQADGSGLYAPQALWSMARESADVTIVVCANRAYHILRVELARLMMGGDPGPKAEALTELRRPPIDWAALATGFGVPACKAATERELSDALTRSLAEPGPTLIEASLPVGHGGRSVRR
jgi:acetolactate synthase-1/2/3 large subunit